MAPIPPKKTTVRHPSHRRVKQVQGQYDKAVQAVEADFRKLRKAMDLDGDTCPEWVIRFIRSTVYPRFRPLVRKIHYTLQTRVFHPKHVQPVRVEAKRRRDGKSGRPNKPTRDATVSGRLPDNAKPGLPDNLGVTPVYRDENISGAGKRLYNYDARQPYTGGKRSGGQRKVPTDCERGDLHDPTNLGSCPLCED